MPSYDEKLEQARAELEAWKNERLRQIKAAHDSEMHRIRENALANMREGLDRALSTYEQALRNIQKMKKEHQAKSPELANRMEKMYTRLEESAKKDYDLQVDFIKTAFKIHWSE